jgi:hypothetical protein
MNLPKLETPKYQLTIPSTQKEIDFRPFLVKEEKILLIAQESGEEPNFIRAMKDIVNSCTFGQIDAGKLPSFDLEYIFLQIRSKSVGEDADLGLKCEECEEVNTVKINLDVIETTKEKPLPNKIELSNEIGIIPQYIKVDDLIRISEIKQSGDALTETITSSIESIYDQANVYPMAEASLEEKGEFVDSLNTTQIKKIEKVFVSAPTLQEKVSFTCKGCGAKNKQLLTGIESFFV